MNTNTSRTARTAHTIAAALLCSTIFTPLANAQEALPTGGQVVSGSATISSNGTDMQIDQSSDQLIANWQGFSIGADNSVTFNQPTAQSVALNRVIGQDPSQILGSLIANGKVFLVNPNGILIGREGSVQTGGFVGSTLDISNSNFLNGNYRFTGTGGSILNRGDLAGGVVALISPLVTNDGTITGDTALVAGTDVTIDFDGDGLIAVEVSASSLATLVENNGLIQADGGLAILTARGASEAMSGVVNNTGVIEAQSLENRDGRILLLGGMDSGTVNAAGTLAASFVETSAANVAIADDLSVLTNGGTWLIDPNDFTIAASGGNISGIALSNNLVNGNVEISTLSQGTVGGEGDIFVNDSVSWSDHVLTLNADRNIYINSEMNATGTAGLSLQYSQRSPDGDYYVNAPVNLASTASFETWDYNLRTLYTIITDLGTEASSGDGTLQGMRGDLSGNYVLGTNIDASDTVNWNGGAGFEPIAGQQESGSQRLSFYGSFEGLGHSIDGLFIYRPETSYVGLFGYVYSGSPSSLLVNVRNVHLKNINVTGALYVGGLAGSARDAYLQNVSAEGSVTAFWESNPVSSGIVGGLVGSLQRGATISGSFAEVDVTGTGTVGGLVGESSGIIEQSYASGQIVGESGVGGLVGLVIEGLIADSYTMGQVTGDTGVGGLVGFNAGTISTSFSASSVSGNTDTGGLVGRNETQPSGPAVVAESFWDSETSGQSQSCGFNNSTCTATGLTTAQMKDISNFTASGWDFDNVWAIDPDINNGYPYLRATVETDVVAPPPPPPPPPPPTTLTVDDFGNFSTSDAPYQPTIVLSGSGFNDVTEITFSWTDPNGQTGTATWNAANNFGNGRFVVSSDSSATISPVLVAAGDPSGTYQWTVTIKTASQTVSDNFTVTYSGVVTPPPPPPPPPEPDPLSLTSGIDTDYFTNISPYQPTFTLVGEGFSDVTAITLTYTDPEGVSGTVTWNEANNFGGGRFDATSDTMATLSPVLVAANDPLGIYEWTISITNGSDTVSRDFSVRYLIGPVQEPVLNVEPDSPASDVVWGLDLDDSQPGLIDFGTANSTLSSYREINLANAELFTQPNPPNGWNVTSEEWAFIVAYYADCNVCSTFSDFEITPEVILHWGRNERNEAANEWMTRYATEDEFLEAGRAAGWFDSTSDNPPRISIAPEDKEVFHENEYEEVHKYISTTGEEWVFDAYTRQLITTDADKGTYNYGSEPVSPEHVDLDIVPWVLFGSGPNDSTTREERERLILDLAQPLRGMAIIALRAYGSF